MLAKCMRRLVLAEPHPLRLGIYGRRHSNAPTRSLKGTVGSATLPTRHRFPSRKKDGSPAGYTIDLCGKITDEIGHKIPDVKREYVETTLADGFNAVKSGRDRSSVRRYHHQS